MTKKAKPVDASQPTGERCSRLDSATLAQIIETQRQELSHVLAVVHSNCEPLCESYRLERGEADLGYCCDAICILLRGVIRTLRPLTEVARVASAADRISLAKALEAQRQVLIRTQAVTELTKLQQQSRGSRTNRDTDLGAVFDSISQTLNSVLNALKPLCLDLPIHVFVGRSDHTVSRH